MKHFHPIAIVNTFGSGRFLQWPSRSQSTSKESTSRGIIQHAPAGRGSASDSAAAGPARLERHSFDMKQECECVFVSVYVL